MNYNLVTNVKLGKNTLQISANEGTQKWLSKEVFTFLEMSGMTRLRWLI